MQKKASAKARTIWQTDGTARPVKPWKNSVASMAYLVRISTRGLRDLEAIYESIHAESSTHAFSWFNAHSEAIYNLEKNPKRGAETPESNVHRQILHGRKHHCYRIIYQVDERGKSMGGRPYPARRDGCVCTSHHSGRRRMTD